MLTSVDDDAIMACSESVELRRVGAFESTHSTSRSRRSILKFVCGLVDTGQIGNCVLTREEWKTSK